MAYNFSNYKINTAPLYFSQSFIAIPKYLNSATFLKDSLLASSTKENYTHPY
jgi:hypothetical protein